LSGVLLGHDPDEVRCCVEGACEDYKREEEKHGYRKAKDRMKAKDKRQKADVKAKGKRQKAKGKSSEGGAEEHRFGVFAKEDRLSSQRVPMEFSLLPFAFCLLSFAFISPSPRALPGK
jgi:hypothetical protein